MNQAKRDLLVARICSGSIRCTVNNHRSKPVTVLVKRPTRDQLYVACEVYEQAYEEAEVSGLHSDDQLLVFMLEQEMWDDSRQSFLDKLPKEIEEFKVQLYKASFKSNERAVVRKALSAAKAKFGQVSHDRHALDHLSCSGAAGIAKARYLLGSSLFYPNGKRVFCDDDFWDQPSVLLDNVMSYYHQHRIDETSYRDLVRNEPWRSTWPARKVEGSVFGLPPCDYTEEQRAVVNWSLLYDNAYQHPECPNEAALNDDDLFDGWMIDQRRKREKDQNKSGAEDAIHDEKIRNSQEVYVVAESVEDARKVVDLNDAHAKATQKMRFDFLKSRSGPVNELEMPDTKQRLRMEAVQALSQRVGQQ